MTGIGPGAPGSDGVYLSINRKQLKAISKVDQPITTGVDGTVPVAEIVQETNRILLSNGEITFQDAGFYRAQIQLNIDNTNNTIIVSWAEFWNGSAWETLDNSAAIIETANANEGNYAFESTFIVPAGFQIRFKARVTAGSATMETLAIPNGVAVPSVTFIAYEL